MDDSPEARGADVDALFTEFAELRATNERLRAALEPFARFAAEGHHPGELIRRRSAGDDAGGVSPLALTWGDLAAARAALTDESELIRRQRDEAARTYDERRAARVAGVAGVSPEEAAALGFGGATEAPTTEA